MADAKEPPLLHKHRASPQTLAIAVYLIFVAYPVIDRRSFHRLLTVVGDHPYGWRSTFYYGSGWEISYEVVNAAALLVCVSTVLLPLAWFARFIVALPASAMLGAYFYQTVTRLSGGWDLYKAYPTPSRRWELLWDATYQMAPRLVLLAAVVLLVSPTRGQPPSATQTPLPRVAEGTLWYATVSIPIRRWWGFPVWIAVPLALALFANELGDHLRFSIPIGFSHWTRALVPAAVISCVVAAFIGRWRPRLALLALAAGMALVGTQSLHNYLHPIDGTPQPLLIELIEDFTPAAFLLALAVINDRTFSPSPGLGRLRDVARIKAAP